MKLLRDVARNTNRQDDSLDIYTSEGTRLCRECDWYSEGDLYPSEVRHHAVCSRHNADNEVEAYG